MVVVVVGRGNESLMFIYSERIWIEYIRFLVVCARVALLYCVTLHHHTEHTHTRRDVYKRVDAVLSRYMAMRMCIWCE